MAIIRLTLRPKLREWPPRRWPLLSYTNFHRCFLYSCSSPPLDIPSLEPQCSVDVAVVAVTILATGNPSRLTSLPSRCLYALLIHQPKPQVNPIQQPSQLQSLIQQFDIPPLSPIDSAPSLFFPSTTPG